MTPIEKAAKLMGEEFYESFINYAPQFENWNPYANKTDLIDLENSLSEYYYFGLIIAKNGVGVFIRDSPDVGKEPAYSCFAKFADHPDKSTARAHAVMAVVEQIYDRREG